MKRLVHVMMIAAALALFGCTGESAEQLMDTARLEELQNNPEHARQLYQEIVEKHPNSKQAEEARKRLKAPEK